MPKKKGAKKKKGKQTKNENESHIAAAIMPSAGIAAVPQSPITVVSEPEGSGVLKQSLLGRLQKSPEVEIHTSETDTSLCDYDNAISTLKPNYRVLPVPSKSLPFLRRQNVEILPEVKEYNLIKHHTVPLATESYNEQMAVRPMSQLTVNSEFTNVSSCDENEDQSPKIVEVYHRTMQDNLRESNDTMQRTRTPVDTVDTDITIGNTQTPQDLLTSSRMRQLHESNLELLRQQKELQAELTAQQAIQEDVLQRLQDSALNMTNQHPDQLSEQQQTMTQEIASIMQETTSVTDKTSKQQTQLIQCLNQQTGVLEAEKHELREIIESMRQQLYEHHSNVQTADEHLLRQLSDLKDNKAVLTSQVQRLSSQLSKKLANMSTNTKMSSLPSDGPIPSWLINNRFVAPLFVAYDDELQHKTQIIQKYQDLLAEIQERVEVVIDENNRLQSINSDHVSIPFVNKLKEQCTLVLEENQIIMEQLKVQEQKHKHQTQIHHKQVSELSQRAALAEANKSVEESELLALKDKCSLLKQQLESSQVDQDVMKKVSRHLREVEELKRLTEEERLQNLRVIEKLEADLKCSQMDQQQQAEYTEELLHKINGMELELKSYRKNNRKSQKTVLVMQKAISSQKTNEHVTSKYLNKMVKVAEQTVLERDSYIQAAQAHEEQSKKAMDQIIEGQLAVKQMKDQLQACKSKYKEKLEKMEARLKAQEKAALEERSEFADDIKHYQLKLLDKDNDINSLEFEHKKLQDNLETVWQATSKESRHMRDLDIRNTERLRKHPSLAAVIKPVDYEDDFNIEDYLTGQCD